MVSIRASFLVTVVAAWAGLAPIAVAAQTPIDGAINRCDVATPASAVTLLRSDDTFVTPPGTCEPATDGPLPTFPSPMQPYDGFSGGTGDSPIRSTHPRHDFLGSVAAFGHVFAAFDAAAAHRLLPHFWRRRRADPPTSIPSF